VVTIEYIHLNVTHQHAFVFPGFPFETNIEVFAEKAAASVCSEYILRSDSVMETVAQHGRGHHRLILFDID
jgi:hypothetical protein